MTKPLTSLQQAYLLGREFYSPLGGVAMQKFREYRGRMDPNLLWTRIGQMVDRHPALRTQIDAVALTQVVTHEAKLNVNELDLRSLPRDEALARIEKMRKTYTHQLLNLDRSPWHVQIFLLPDSDTEDTLVVFTLFDALILDGQSITSLLAELFSKDMAQLEDAEENASVIQQPASSNREEDEAYWTEKLKEISGPPALPWKVAPETIKSSTYARQSLHVPKERWRQLRKVGAREQLFGHSTLAAVILETLTRRTAEGTLCIAVPVATPSEDGQLDNTSSFVALNYDNRQGAFLDRARRLQADTLEGLAHKDFSGVDLNRMLMTKNPGRLALPVVLTNGLSWTRPEADSPMRLVGGLTQTPQVALDVRLALDANGNLEINIDYAEKALHADFIEDLLGSISRAIMTLCQHDAFELTADDFITVEHYKAQEKDGVFTCSNFLSRIADHLFDQAPQKDALICGGRHISYAELGQSVARVISNLQARDLGKGNVVAVCLPRGPEHVMTVLACALLGITWVPIDAGAPAERKKYLLENCNPDLIVGFVAATEVEVVAPHRLFLSTQANGAEIVPQNLADLSQSDDPGYYLYTSGTTGKPKCVMVSNRATSNVIFQTQKAWDIRQEDVLMSVTPLHHDMSVFDVFGSLSAGATLVIPATGDEKNAIRWNRLVKQHGVSVWCSVPAILEMLLECRQGDELQSLRLIAQGGDYIKPETIETLRALLPDTQLYSLGGPTETTIWSIWHEIMPDDISIIPYGQPLAGNRYYSLNDLGEHVPPYVVGRIHTAGVNLAIGYLKDGQIDQTDFIEISDAQGCPTRVFRTGDLGYFRKDGTLIFASRVNGYVKVRGVRVSLTDIENELGKHDDIKQLMVVDYKEPQSGEMAIATLCVPHAGKRLEASELRDFARGLLPETHIPSRFLCVDQLPLSANGKVDRRQARAMLEGAGDMHQLQAS